MKDLKNIPLPTKLERDGKPGRHVNPDKWITGPDIVRRDKYYGFLRHRAQAKYRKEDYQLTFEQFESLWSNDDWFRRGKAIDKLCMSQINYDIGWVEGNVEVITRGEQLRRPKKERVSDD